jgi:hypothetical protein
MPALHELELGRFAVLADHRPTVADIVGAPRRAIGALIARSTFLPRIIGALLLVAGLGYLADSSMSFWPALRPWVFPYTLYPGALAEGSIALWLFFVGVNPSKWEKQAARR